jgi:hypothetical protein
MTSNKFEYTPIDGYIHNWLVAGPRQIALSEQPKNRLDACRQFATGDFILTETPVERDNVSLGDEKLRWLYYRTQADHQVGMAAHSAVWQVVQVFAYAQVHTPTAQKVTFALAANALVDVWVNGQGVFQGKELPEGGLSSTSVSVQLNEGQNDVLVRLTQVARGDMELRLALRLAGLTDGSAQIVLPTHANRPDRHYRLEKILDYAYLEDVVCYRGAHFNVRWDTGLTTEAQLTYEVQDAGESIYVTGNLDAHPDNPYNAGHEYRMREQPYWLALRATGAEYYDQNLRYQRKLPIFALDTFPAQTPYGTFPQRQREALEHAAQFEKTLFGQIANMQLAKWENVKVNALLAAAERVSRNETSSDQDLLGLLGACMRFASETAFPNEINPVVKAGATHANYALEADATASANIVRIACQVLAGQHYAQATFDNGASGETVRQAGEQAALAWLQQHGAQGLAVIDSQEYEQAFVALAHLASLAQDENMRELSAVMLDKLLFTLAIHSYRGAYEHAPHKSAQLEPVAGVMRMMWGMGVFNPNIAGVVSLACSSYEFPVFIGEIAKDGQEMWNRECQQGCNQAVYRTDDYLLASWQDYRKGQPGGGEHIWQATLDADAVVFVNHPACIRQEDAGLPGFWHGNDVLPRVAQWKDMLVAVHHIPDEAWLDFTHAYFPIYAFDEYVIADGWAFARKGNGYLALTAARGLDWVKTAPDGYRELRSHGRQNIWLCQMGSFKQDGDFATFQQKVRALPITFGELSLSCTGLRGETLSFGWDEPFKVNGQEQPLSGFKHFENPYCTAEFPATSLEIAYQGTAMRLSFE